MLVATTSDAEEDKTLQAPSTLSYDSLKGELLVSVCRFEFGNYTQLQNDGMKKPVVFYPHFSILTCRDLIIRSF